jgi:type I restriction enzyme S subunit
VALDRVAPEFLYQTLFGLNDLIVALADESAHGTLKIESAVLSNLKIPVPPMHEQLEIAQRMREVDTLLGNFMWEATSINTLLEERRSALISAAVTGKIDVRNYVSSEPAELEEAYEPA